MANLKTKLSVSIDVSKIDKTRIVSKDKNGNPFKNGAKYYSIDVIIFDETNEFGSDVMVVQGQTKEERENKEKSVPIGNGKTVYNTQPSTPTPPKPNQSMQSPPPPPPSFMDDVEDELPF